MTAVDRPDNGQDEEYAGPCIACGHPAREHDTDGECWLGGCPCGTGEPGDPMLTSGRAGAGEQQREQMAVNAARDFLDGLRRHSTNPTLLRAIADVEAELQPDPGPQCPSTSHDTDGGWRCEHRAGHDLTVKHRNGEVEW